MGTPAFPTAAIVATKTQASFAMSEKWIPLLSAMKSVVIKIKAAQPFILMVVHNGSAQLATSGDNLALSTLAFIAVTNLAVDDLLKKAKVRAGTIALASARGEIL